MDLTLQTWPAWVLAETQQGSCSMTPFPAEPRRCSIQTLQLTWMPRGIESTTCCKKATTQMEILNRSSSEDRPFTQRAVASMAQDPECNFRSTTCPRAIIHARTRLSSRGAEVRKGRGMWRTLHLVQRLTNPKAGIGLLTSCSQAPRAIQGLTARNENLDESKPRIHQTCPSTRGTLR